MYSQVTRERAPAAWMWKTTAKNAVGTGHVSGMSHDRADIVLGAIARPEPDNAHGHPRREQHFANEFSGCEPRLSRGLNDCQPFIALPRFARDHRECRSIQRIRRRS